MAFNPKSVTTYLKSKFTGQGSNEQLNLLADRFVQLFVDHGVEKTQIPRVFPKISLQDLSSKSALLEKLTPSLIDEAAKLFNVRSEWLEGIDEEIYPFFSCSKHPEILFELMQQIDVSVDDYPFRILTGPDKLDFLSDKYQPILIVVLKKITTLNDENIYRYYIDTKWDWSYEPCRIQLKAMAYQFHKVNKIPIPIYKLSKQAFEKVTYRECIPKPYIEKLIITDPSLEDYVLRKNQSVQAKEVEELPKVKAYAVKHKLGEFAISSNRKLHQVDDSQETTVPPTNSGQQVISDMARKNANKRYERPNELKQQFQLFYENCQHTNKSKAARDYFESLDFSDQILIVPTYEQDNHKDSLKKAVRNLTSSLK